MKTDVPAKKKNYREVKRHLRDVKLRLYINLFNAYRGLWQWHLINKTKGFDKTEVVLLPGLDHESNYLALIYLDKLLDRKGADNAVILTYDPGVLKTAKLFSDRILDVRKFDRKKCEHLMQLYSLYEFAPNFTCASIDEPYGRNGDKLVGKRGTTKEEIFVIGVYRLYPFERPERPKYIGDDRDILNFLDVEL